jgi:hypothetical protein
MVFHFGRIDRFSPFFDHPAGPVIRTIIHDNKFERAVTLQSAE